MTSLSSSVTPGAAAVTVVAPMIGFRRVSLLLLLRALTAAFVVAAATTDGPAGSCNYRYTPSTSQRGNVSTPGYPLPGYQGPLTCRYEFAVNPSQSTTSVAAGVDWRIRLRFIDFKLNFGHDDPSSPTHCDPGVDRTGIRFGSKMSQLYAVYCGTKLPPMLMSSGDWAEILFESLSRSSERGFQVEYSFVTDFGIKVGEQNVSNGCWFSIISGKHPSSGKITSPNHPGLYPRNVTCHYLFYGRPNERIHLTFTQFNIDGIQRTKCDDKTDSDYVELSIDPPPPKTSTTSEGAADRPGASMSRRMERDLADVAVQTSGRAARATKPLVMTERSSIRMCGDTASPNSVRSSSNFLRVTFHSNEKYDQIGFAARYEFKTASSNERDESVNPPEPSYTKYHDIAALAMTSSPLTPVYLLTINAVLVFISVCTRD